MAFYYCALERLRTRRSMVPRGAHNFVAAGDRARAYELQRHRRLASGTNNEPRRFDKQYRARAAYFHLGSATCCYYK